MKIRTRLFVAFFLIVGLGFYLLVNAIVDDLRPRYLETMEESMVEMATLLSSFVGNQIVDGKLKKYFAQVCLLEQGFVKEPKQSVTSLLSDKSKELDDTLEIRSFQRFQLGE